MTNFIYLNFLNFLIIRLGCSSEDPNEIWPQIMEKAYAKMYGGYFSIDNGGLYLYLFVDY